MRCCCKEEQIDCDWKQITDRTAWCRAHGSLRHGTLKRTDYVDDETGQPLTLTSTGYYHPNGSWREGAVPCEFRKDVYGEPYTYESYDPYDQLRESVAQLQKAVAQMTGLPPVEPRHRVCIDNDHRNRDKS